jgi:hypothetical protein
LPFNALTAHQSEIRIQTSQTIELNPITTAPTNRVYNGKKLRMALRMNAITKRHVDCQAWKRTYALLLYGAMARKKIAGTTVMYAIAPREFSDRPDGLESGMNPPFQDEDKAAGLWLPTLQASGES